MIFYKPLPLLEAMIFLENRATGFSWKTYIDERTGSEPKNPANTKLREYGRILIEIERRLDDKITASESCLSRLFTPINNEGREPNCHLGTCIGDLIISDEIETFQIPDGARFMEKIRQNIHLISNSILENTAGEDACREEKIEINDVLTSISKSALSADSKMMLVDLVATPQRYVDMLEQAVLPVAEEFRRCDELIKPLLDVYMTNYGGKTASGVLRGILRNTSDNFGDFIMYPLITCSNKTLFTFDKSNPPRVLGCVGVLQHFINSNYVFNKDNEKGLSFIMSAAGNKNRFGIIERLLSGPAYGRELASHLELSPASISLHISVLVSAGLVTVHNEGTRVYYSLNMDNAIRFAERLKAFFSESHPNSGETKLNLVHSNDSCASESDV